MRASSEGAQIRVDAEEFIAQACGARPASGSERGI
jgi:hypothetical protein